MQTLENGSEPPNERNSVGLKLEQGKVPAPQVVSERDATSGNTLLEIVLVLMISDDLGLVFLEVCIELLATIVYLFLSIDLCNSTLILGNQGDRIDE